MLRLNKFKKGFTLIELLVVIAIIGLLSTIVLSNIATARAKARDTQRISDIRQLRTALQLYYESNNQSYPLTLSSLAPTYIGSIPKDPSNQTFGTGCGGAGWYCYAVLPSSAPVTFYHLGALLEAPNAVLNSDKDCRSDSSAPVCAAGTFGNGTFNGASNGPGGTDNVYDLTS
ncbi:MAG TPA: type II secretion system protein [Candidatus Paceibacterota bacterium]|nr:type II secretion system protein [Candidatus Paceibacterota bacterium]